jgi:hypothetical protein
MAVKVVHPQAAPSEKSPRYWRIRMKYAGGDVTEKAWSKGVVGIWYGAWNASQFEKTMHLSNREAATALTKFNRAVTLDWKVTAGYVSTARRFWSIQNRDWVFTYFEDAIHLARVATPTERESRRTFSENKELFKSRRIRSKKSFKLHLLPDCFRLLGSAGRGNIHEVGATRTLVQLLAECSSESEVRERFRLMSWDDWLDVLGPSGWEALCLGYLILEADFVPTGLDIGRTLPLFDLVGKAKTGQKIYAQCKKNPEPMVIDKEFVDCCKGLVSKCSVYLFTEGGCTNVPKGVKLVTGSDLRKWFSTSKVGQNYMHLLRT